MGHFHVGITWFDDDAVFERLVAERQRTLARIASAQQQP
jgi:hypothetical protein